MNKVMIALLMITSSSLVLAEQTNWIETQEDSHIFVNKDEIKTNKDNPDIRTITISINIPSMQDRRANPTKTVLTNPYPLSYVTQFEINCKDKAGKMGEQRLYENFFGSGKLLEESPADTNAQFAPLDGVDAMQLWEIACTPQ